jgi:ABC-type uncharacterized transport system involved in gliding motility auxiliary subunit
MTAVRRRLAVAIVIAIGLVVLQLLVAENTRRQIDLTADRSLTLTSESSDIVRRLHDPVQITAFLGPTDPTRAGASTLLSRYQRLNPRISFRLVDPASASAEAARLHVDPVFGGIAVVRGQAVEVAQTATEQDITAAMARLLRGKGATACVAQGHGEADPESTLDAGISSAVALLRENGYALMPIDLLTKSSVPSTCQVLLLVNPTASLGAAQDAISAYLAGGGRALVLADPSSTVDLNPILNRYGLGIARGIVLEGDANARFPNDPTRPVVFHYESPVPIVNRLPPTFYPGAQAVTTPKVDLAGLVVAALARTSANSYLARHPLSGPFDPAVDIPGPITLVAVADYPGNFGGRVQRTRLVVFGNSGFASNAFIGQAGNSNLLLRSLDWATLEEDLVTVSANLPRPRPLDLTEGRLTYIRILSAGVVPGLFLLLGALTWALRRGR